MGVGLDAGWLGAFKFGFFFHDGRALVEPFLWLMASVLFLFDIPLFPFDFLPSFLQAAMIEPAIVGGNIIGYMMDACGNVLVDDTNV